jgi:lipid-A-disaccharide synthase
MEVRHHVDTLSVTGFSEALCKLPTVGRMLVDCWRHLLRRRPQVALLVDYPGANLRLAAMCRRLKIPTVFYVAPQRWAWLSFRAKSLSRLDQLAVVLPFEAPWFARRGVNATFVGHPLCEELKPSRDSRARPAFRVNASLTPTSKPRPLATSTITSRGSRLMSKPVIALLAGSRENELSRHLPLLRDCLPLLGSVEPVIGVAAGTEATCRSYLPHVTQTSAREALASADVALCCSGTVTLEAALIGTPMVCFYQLSPLSYALASWLVRVPFISLPNLIAGRQIVPELIQRDATPERLAAETRRVLGVDGVRQREAFSGLYEKLVAKGHASERVADMLEAYL